MGTLFRLLLTKLLPARLAWVVAVYVFGRALATRRASVTSTATTRRVVR